MKKLILLFTLVAISHANANEQEAHEKNWLVNTGRVIYNGAKPETAHAATHDGRGNPDRNGSKDMSVHDRGGNWGGGRDRGRDQDSPRRSNFPRQSP